MVFSLENVLELWSVLSQDLLVDATIGILHVVHCHYLIEQRSVFTYSGSGCVLALQLRSYR
jgi:hypothetical protein